MPRARETLILSLGFMFFAAPLQAQSANSEAPTRSTSSSRTRRYEVDPVTDTVLIASTTVLTLSMELIIAGGDLGGATVGDRDDLFVLDRPFAKKSSAVGGMATLSNVGMGLMIGYEGFRLLRVGLDEDWESSLIETTLVLESAMFAAAFTNLTKLAIRRPRPNAYAEGRVSVSTDDSVSFFSGHAAVTAAVAATAIYLVWDRAPESVEAWLTTAGAVVLALGVSVARVLALRHFPTDVAAGLVTGGTIGLLVPHLHRADGRDLSIGVTVDGESQAGLQISGVF